MAGSVQLNVLPIGMPSGYWVLESKPAWPVSDVTVWGMSVDIFVHTTVSPAWAVAITGLNVMFSFIETFVVPPPPPVVPVVAVVPLVAVVDPVVAEVPVVVVAVPVDPVVAVDPVDPVEFPPVVAEIWPPLPMQPRTMMVAMNAENAASLLFMADMVARGSA